MSTQNKSQLNRTELSDKAHNLYLSQWTSCLLHVAHNARERRTPIFFYLFFFQLKKIKNQIKIKSAAALKTLKDLQVIDWEENQSRVY